MREIVFDFNKIETIHDFYAEAFSELQLSDDFGYNLDALWDCVSTEITLPVDIKFTNLSKGQLIEFEDLITLFQDTATEYGDEFRFSYSLKKYPQGDKEEFFDW